MSYGRSAYATFPYAGVGAGTAAITTDTQTALAVEWSPTTGAFETPVWVDIADDVRSWNTGRGRNRELERFQPGRATIVLSNLDRQYDSVNAAGPNYGNIKPNRRIRIRETFNGVTYPIFDGYVDKIKLDYPNTGKDATATFTATDGMKLLARTELPRSVYYDAVKDDGAAVYWPLDEQKESAPDGTLLALNSGTLGSIGDGTYKGPPALGEEALVVNDPGTSIGVVNSGAAAGTTAMGVEIAAASFPLVPTGVESFAFEAWCIPRNTPGSNGYLLSVRNAADTVKIEVLYTLSNTFVFNVNHTTPVSLSTSPTTFAPHARAHIVGRCVVGSVLQMWVNGTLFTGGTPAGTIDAAGTLRLGHLVAASPSVNWLGSIAHVSFYRDAAAVAIDTTWVARHYAAGTAPWNADLPGARIGRVLDEATWPSTLRELDAGITTLQSAEIGSQSALEHAQKVGESEFGLFFITRDGKVRLVGRTALFARNPDAAVTYGDQAGQVGYRDFTPDDGDEVIRNRAIISRLNGVAKTATDAASITAFGPFDYTLDGLLHSSDSYSLDYANLIVDEYGIQQRRITSLTLGPPITGDEDIVYPAMLGPELGDAITVTNTPIGGGAAFTQVCAVEGIMASGSPGGVRQTTFILSPEFAIRTLEDVDVATLGYAQTTTGQGAISAEADLTGLSVVVTVGSSRRIRVSAGIPEIDNDGTAGAVVGRIKEGATQLEVFVTQSMIASGFTCGFGSVVLTPSAGSHTYKLTLNKAVGAGTLQTTASAALPAFILVEDIGPS